MLREYCYFPLDGMLVHRGVKQPPLRPAPPPRPLASLRASSPGALWRLRESLLTGYHPPAVCRRSSCPFRKRSLPFLRHLENFWPAIGSVSIKKKENRIPGSNMDLEPGPFVSSSLSLTTVPQLGQCSRHFTPNTSRRKWLYWFTRLNNKNFLKTQLLIFATYKIVNII